MIAKKAVKESTIAELTPKRIICQVSSDAIFHKEYPILIPGKALPHKIQQSITPRNVTISFFREEACICPLTPLYISYFVFSKTCSKEGASHTGMVA